MNGLKKKLWHIYNEILPIQEKGGYPAIATTWMDSEHIMLSEASQTEKEKYCMASLICEL